LLLAVTVFTVRLVPGNPAGTLRVISSNNKCVGFPADALTRMVVFDMLMVKNYCLFK